HSARPVAAPPPRARLSPALARPASWPHSPPWPAPTIPRSPPAYSNHPPAPPRTPPAPQLPPPQRLSTAAPLHRVDLDSPALGATNPLTNPKARDNAR